MAQKPGIRPLGNSPFGKEKLESHKKHHDDHGMDDSVPAKGSKRAVPGQAWEKQYDMQQPRDRPEAKFDPRQAKVRNKMYNKTNDTDH